MSPNLVLVNAAEPSTPAPAARRRSRSLLAAAVLAGLQALAVVAYAVAEIGYGVVGLSGMAVAVGVFLGAYGVAIGWAVRLLLQRRSSARAPLVLAQLLHLCLAWNAREAPLTAYAAAAAVWSALTLVALLWPATTRDLADPEEGAAAAQA